MLICTVAFSLALTGCSKSLTNADKTIVTSSYPLEFIVHEIVRDDFVVEYCWLGVPIGVVLVNRVACNL